MLKRPPGRFSPGLVEAARPAAAGIAMLKRVFPLLPDASRFAAVALTATELFEVVELIVLTEARGGEQRIAIKQLS